MRPSWRRPAPPSPATATRPPCAASRATAGVDPALVHHYFPDRATLFAKAVIESTAGVDANLTHRAAGLTELEPERLGEGIVRSVISLWDEAGADRFTAVIHAALGQGGRVEPFRDFIAIGVLSPIVTHFCPDRPQLRAQLIASQIIGLGLARWVARMDHIAGSTSRRPPRLVGPTIHALRLRRPARRR